MQIQANRRLPVDSEIRRELFVNVINTFIGKER